MPPKETLDLQILKTRKRLYGANRRYHQAANKAGYGPPTGCLEDPEIKFARLSLEMDKKIREELINV